MPPAQFETYYWEIYTLIFESDDMLLLDDPAFSISDPDTARIAQIIQVVLPFRDNSRLYVEILLVGNGEIIEERYAYIYYDAQEQRLLQYDNRDHHPEIATHPHHMHKGPTPSAGQKDQAWPTDIDFVCFETVLQRIRERFFYQ
jgi:hypothetical protein